MKFIELNHRITNGMVTFPGMPGVVIDAYMTREESGRDYGEKANSLLDRIQMVNISGTYLDSPNHRFENGYTVADIPLEKCANLRYQVVDLPEGKKCFDKEDLQGVGIKGGAVLLHTDHDQKFGTDAYGENVPYLSVEGAQYLIDKGVVFVGIDTPLIDDNDRMMELGNPVHDIILGAGGIVCEDMTNLKAAIPYQENGRLYAAPARVEMASFTTRVFVQTNED